MHIAYQGIAHFWRYSRYYDVGGLFLRTCKIQTTICSEPVYVAGIIPRLLTTAGRTAVPRTTDDDSRPATAAAVRQLDTRYNSMYSHYHILDGNHDLMRFDVFYQCRYRCTRYSSSIRSRYLVMTYILLPIRAETAGPRKTDNNSSRTWCWYCCCAPGRYTDTHRAQSTQQSHTRVPSYGRKYRYR